MEERIRESHEAPETKLKMYTKPVLQEMGDIKVMTQQFIVSVIVE